MYGRNQRFRGIRKLIMAKRKFIYNCNKIAGKKIRRTGNSIVPVKMTLKVGKNVSVFPGRNVQRRNYQDKGI